MWSVRCVIHSIESIAAIISLGMRLERKNANRFLSRAANLRSVLATPSASPCSRPVRRA